MRGRTVQRESSKKIVFGYSSSRSKGSKKIKKKKESDFKNSFHCIDHPDFLLLNIYKPSCLFLKTTG